MQRFSGKVALVTGASAGIGQATARRLAAEGARVLVCDVQPLDETLAQIADLAEAGAGEAAAESCDVSDPQACAAVVERCLERFGRLDVLCNVAGILRMAHTLEVDDEHWRQILDVNLSGTFFMCRAALPALLEAEGNIVNTASTASLAGTAYATAYAASKGGVLALTRSLAIEYGKQGLRANAVCPGAIRTAMTLRNILPKDCDMELILRGKPLARPAGPEDVAGSFAFLASDDAIHVNGVGLRVDGATLS